MPALIPCPVALSATDAAPFVLTGETRIATTPRLEGAARALARALRTATGFALPVTVGGGGDIVFADAPDAPGVSGGGGDDAGTAAEAYTLDVAASGIRIGATHPRGALWAGQTLRQLLPAAVYRRAALPGVAWTVPAVHIRDRPAFAWRGVMLDVARHFFTVAEVCRLVDQLAAHKINTLHLHLTDDQGWRLQIRRHPRLTEVGATRAQSRFGAGGEAALDGRPHGGFYTQDDAREIVAYARVAGIRVVPEIEMPGHVQAALAAYPELGVRGVPLEPWTDWGVSRHILNAEESTVAFFCDVLDEVIELFDSPYIGIGGDECPKDQWDADARTAALMRERGIADTQGLQSWFVARIDAHLTARGRRAFGWDEILEGGLADGATVASWRGMTGLLAAARGGHDAVACPEDRVYLDYRQSDAADEPIPVATVTDLERVYAVDPVPEALEERFRGHILGGQGNLWTEHVDSARRVDYMLFPRVCALAEALWSGPGGDFAEFQARMPAQRERLAAMGVEFRPDAGPLPWQRIPAAPGRPTDRADRAATAAAGTADPR